MKNTEKNFTAKWGDWEPGQHSYPDNEEIVNSDFFSEDKGYTEEDMKAIDNLQPGDTWNSEYGNHSVRREA